VAAAAAAAAAAARSDGGITVLFGHGLAGEVALFTSDLAVAPRVRHPPACARAP